MQERQVADGLNRILYRFTLTPLLVYISAYQGSELASSSLQEIEKGSFASAAILGTAAVTAVLTAGFFTNVTLRGEKFLRELYSSIPKPKKFR